MFSTMTRCCKITTTGTMTTRYCKIVAAPSTPGARPVDIIHERMEVEFPEVVKIIIDDLGQISRTSRTLVEAVQVVNVLAVKSSVKG